jgi:hypothetical protein
MIGLLPLPSSKCLILSGKLFGKICEQKCAYPEKALDIPEGFSALYYMQSE